MTGAANTVSEYLARIDMPPRMTRFLRCLERATFGWAGVHRANGRKQPGSWCPFELTDWVERTQMSHSQILHIQQRLVDDGLIWYEAEATTCGRGSIGWNLNFALWKPLQPGYPHWGGARPGAGRPRTSEATTRVVNLNIADEDMGQEVAPDRSTPGATSHPPRQKTAVVNLKNHAKHTGKGKAADRSTPGGISSLQLAVPAPDAHLHQGTRTENSSLQLTPPDQDSSLQLQGASSDFKMTTPHSDEPALEGNLDVPVRRELPKKNTKTTQEIPTEPPLGVSAASFSPREPDMSGQHPSPAPAPHECALAAPPSLATRDVILQVPHGQVAIWREDVAEQRQVVTQMQAAYERACEALEQCSPGGTGWGELRREQRYWQHQLEAARDKLAEFTRFLALIEQGATKDEAGAAVRGLETNSSADEPEELAHDSAEIAQADQPPALQPRLEGQALRRAHFATLARLFTNGDPRHVDLERGKFNRAIKNFVLVGLQPGDVLAVKAAFEHLWPRATCTALGLANNLPLLIGTAEGMGLYLQATEVTP